MSARYLYVPVTGKLEVLDAYGNCFRPRGVLEIVGRRLCIVGRWVQSRGSLHQVAFGDDVQVWVDASETQWYDEVVRSA